MVANLIPYAIRGAIWYQGESNAGRAWQYRSLFGDMIQNWRQDWGQGNFPFYAVQLAPWDMNRKRELSVIANEVGNSAWAELREAQNYVAETLPNAGVAVITDLGDKDDIHPTKKAPVGARLALLARANVYKQPVEAYGPTLRTHSVVGSEVVLTFTHTAGGLRTFEGAPLTGFTIAGADGVFHKANAKFRGNSVVVVSSPDVPKPAAVRYGWADYPVVNLMNGAGLPASPFRTDRWVLTTQKVP
jgi:sialate O-acetylesterase